MSTYCNHYKKDDFYYYDKEKVVLECKRLSGTGALMPPATSTTPPTVRSLGSLSIDLKRLCNPCVKIDVTTVIDYSGDGGDEMRLIFRVFKQCDDKPEIELDSFEYAKAQGNIQSDSFNFTVCDCDCDGCRECCCTYRVEVEAAGTFGEDINARVVKGTISALAVSNFKRC